MIVDHRIAGTRITVWDVQHHLENDWPLDGSPESLDLRTSKFKLLWIIFTLTKMRS